jgi:hypothetical protein
MAALAIVAAANAAAAAVVHVASEVCAA